MNKIIDTIPATLAAVLTHLMNESGLTCSELARNIGIAQPVIYRLMSGETTNPQLLTILPIARYFKVDVDQLIGLKPLNHSKVLSDSLIEPINNKLSTIKVITSTLQEVLPILIMAYQTAIQAKIIDETTPLQIMPLLQMNIDTLLKSIQFIETLLNVDNNQASAN